MTIFLSDNEILKEINDYQQPNWIWIDIWEMSAYEIQIVITINKNKMCKLSGHKVIHICSAKTDESNEIENLKKYGTRIVRLLRRRFPNSEVHSDLRYH